AFPSADVDLEPHYDLTLGAVDRVADRSTQVLAISPRDELRYGYRPWLDQETAMPPGVQLFDGAGARLGEIRFTEIEIGIDIPAQAVEPTIDTTGFSVQRTPLPTASGAGAGSERGSYRARGLPNGFRVSSSMQMFVAGSEEPVDHIVISDGLATISAVVERRRDGGRPGAEESFSNAAGTTLVYSARRGRSVVTVIGEAPPATLRSIGLSLTND